MRCQSDVIHCYEQIKPITSRMLALARAGDWDAMAPLEEEFRRYVDHLKTIESSHPLDPSELEKKYLLLRQILADDAEIRDLLTPQVARLGILMGNLRRQQNLNQAYGR